MQRDFLNWSDVNGNGGHERLTAAAAAIGNSHERQCAATQTASGENHSDDKQQRLHQFFVVTVLDSFTFEMERRTATERRINVVVAASQKVVDEQLFVDGPLLTTELCC